MKATKPTEMKRRTKRIVMMNKREARRRLKRSPNLSQNPSLRERTKKMPPPSLRRSLNVNNNDCYKVNNLSQI